VSQELFCEELEHNCLLEYFTPTLDKASVAIEFESHAFQSQHRSPMTSEHMAQANGKAFADIVSARSAAVNCYNAHFSGTSKNACIEQYSRQENNVRIRRQLWDLTYILERNLNDGANILSFAMLYNIIIKQQIDVFFTGS
jgi:hypothetical protein